MEIETTLPVIFVADGSSISLAMRAMESGAFSCLEKSGSEYDLRQTIMKAFDRNKVLRNENQERVMLQEGLESLTDSERKVFGLVTHGVLNKQVAMKLGVSLRTDECNRREMNGRI